jgi:hypothetical protein
MDCYIKFTYLFSWGNYEYYRNDGCYRGKSIDDVAAGLIMGGPGVFFIIIDV